LSINPAMLLASMLGTTLRVRLRNPLVFLVVPTCWELCFSIMSILDLPFSSLYFLDHHTGHPAHHDAWILLYECILDAVWIFSSSFRSIGSLLPMGCQSTSFRLARLQTGQMLSRFILFSFVPTCMLFDLSTALRLCHDLSKVVASAPRSGACETWVPLGPHRPGSRSSLTSRSDLPEDPLTC
jgi:hypothetical protein